jgi:guanylate kinase
MTTAESPRLDAPSRRAPRGQPLLIVISAPSGGGKTTLCQNLLAADPRAARAITCTTRAPRPGEQEGVDYYFLDPATFARRAQAGEFLEHATVHDRSYGTLKAEVFGRLQAGQDVLLNIDVQGAASIRAQAAADAALRRVLVSVFLVPPSLEVLEQRLRKRGTDPEATIQQRLSAARQEIAAASHFDYVMVSDSIAEDLRRLQVIVEAETMRPGRAPLPFP